MSAMTKRLAGRLSVMLVTAMLLSIIAPAYAADKIASGSILISTVTDVMGSVNINVGKGEGMKVGTKGVVIKDGKQIADYEVLQVNWGFSRVAISNLASGYTVQPGDSAPIASTPGKAPSVKKKSPSKMILVIAGIAAAALLLGKSRGGGGGSSGNNTITLSAQKTSNADGSSTITVTANVRDQNGFSVPDGTVVTFSTTAGTLNRTQASTSAGRAIVVLTTDSWETADIAVVTAKSLEQTATLTVSLVSSIELVANPTSIQIMDSGGAQTQSTITATCQDAAGNPATTGEVTFTSNIGTITNKVPIGSNGRAITTFTSRSAGKANITASWSKSTESVEVTVTAGPPHFIAVSGAPTSVPSDGNSFSTITATVRDAGNNLATDGTKVHFSTTLGTILPEQVSTVNGVGTARLYSTVSGTATVRVEVRAGDQPSDVPAPASDIINQNTTVQFISSSVGEIILSANPTNITYNVDKTTTITAVVRNTEGQSVPNGTQVTFTATHSVLGNNGISTTSNGVATITLRPDGSGIPSWNGLVNVTATAGGVTASRDGLVIFSGPPSGAYSTAVVSPASIPKLNGTATVTVTAHDVNDNPIADGIAVTVVTSKVRTTITPSSGVTADGVATFTLTTSTDSDHPTDLGGGNLTVTVSSGGAGSQWITTVPFTVVD